MNTPSSKAAPLPLNRYPVFETSDADQFRAVAVDAYGACHVELARFDATPSCGNVAALTDVTLGYSHCGEADIRFPEADFARVQFAIEGQGRLLSAGRETIISAGTAAITSPGRPSTIAYGRGFRQLYLRVRRTALERKLAALLGASVKGPLEFAAEAATASGPMLGLRQLMGFVVDQLDATPAGLPAPVLVELESALIVALLCATKHNFSRLIVRDATDAAPNSVRLAEEFIRAHSHLPITIEQLVTVSGVSARTLHYSFQRHRGYSPHQFVKRVRLERARELLQAPTPQVSVTGIALSCGFSNLGHFSRDYRLAFGELPSMALARALAGNRR